MVEAGPATIVPGSPPDRRGVVGPPSQLHLRPPPSTGPHHHHAIEGFAKASGDHRTSFAPETFATRRNKHNRTRPIFRKINASGSCPAAHNGLVGGSSPPGPTILHFRFASSRWPVSTSFAIGSRAKLMFDDRRARRGSPVWCFRRLPDRRRNRTGTYAEPSEKRRCGMRFCREPNRRWRVWRRVGRYLNLAAAGPRQSRRVKMLRWAAQRGLE
jgi:hypothetical protein